MLGNVDNEMEILYKEKYLRYMNEIFIAVPAPGRRNEIKQEVEHVLQKRHIKARRAIVSREEK